MTKHRRNSEVYPGIDNRFVICDVCGKKFRVKDTLRIVDRFNLLNNMIVCFADADKANPQIKPIHIHEDLLVRKDYVRPEATFFTYVTDNEDTIGGPPRNLVASVEPLSNLVQLQWDGPLDYGNAVVLGYRVYRRYQLSFPDPSLTVQDTHSLATYFLDLTSDIDEYYTYQVSMLTDLGESALSNIAYFPKQLSLSVLQTTQSELDILTTQLGLTITIEN